MVDKWNTAFEIAQDVICVLNVSTVDRTAVRERRDCDVSSDDARSALKRHGFRLRHLISDICECLTEEEGKNNLQKHIGAWESFICHDGYNVASVKTLTKMLRELTPSDAIQRAIRMENEEPCSSSSDYSDSSTCSTDDSDDDATDDDGGDDEEEEMEEEETASPPRKRPQRHRS